MKTQSLPFPEKEALNHSKKLLDHILTEIRKNKGIISFAHYMELALYTPGLGYYNVGTQKLGQGGDFVTAPEISSLFSYCLAHQCQEILEILKGGDILEIGAGSGQMAADILIRLSELNCLPKRYYILELSADLKARQKEKILALCPQFIDCIQWLEKLPDFPFIGIIIANEVLDAMPVHIFQTTSKEIKELWVTENQGALSPLYSLVKTPKLRELFSSYNWPEGYISEINLNLTPWIHSLSDFLKKGVMIFIDYGFPRSEYYHPDRNQGTLMCHYQHHSHTDPFLYPGLQDITAHVDFTSIKEAAEKAQLDILGYTTQAGFLLSLGLLELVTLKRQDNEKINFYLNNAIQTLTSPAEMGELFKVIALSRDIDQELQGFSLSNRLLSLNI